MVERDGKRVVRERAMYPSIDKYDKVSIRAF